MDGPLSVRAYLRASTSDQDANRARDQLKAFAADRGLSIAVWYVENESGTKLSRPELFRLLTDAQPGDPLLVEQVVRLSRQPAPTGKKLKAELKARRVCVVALDLPTSWLMATNNADEFTGRMFEAINGMLLDMLAAVARKDYDDRRKRQAQGEAEAYGHDLVRTFEEAKKRVLPVSEETAQTVQTLSRLHQRSSPSYRSLPRGNSLFAVVMWGP